MRCLVKKMGRQQRGVWPSDVGRWLAGFVRGFVLQGQRMQKIFSENSSGTCRNREARPTQQVDQGFLAGQRPDDFREV
jgi:hypothetical protein